MKKGGIAKLKAAVKRLKIKQIKCKHRYGLFWKHQSEFEPEHWSGWKCCIKCGYSIHASFRGEPSKKEIKAFLKADRFVGYPYKLAPKETP